VSSKIGIIDYGMGNLRSVEKGLEKAGTTCDIISDPDALAGYPGLILPGVGAFADAMTNLKERGMDVAIIGCIESGKPLMGICLGMQLLLEFSDEHGRSEGLGVVPGGVVRLPATVKVPHMGWNVLHQHGEQPLFDSIEEGSRFYFVHSYYCDPSDESWIIGTAPYGLEFACAIGRDNVLGVQFHPEKSSLLGLRMLSNFAGIVEASNA